MIYEAQHYVTQWIQQFTKTYMKHKTTVCNDNRNMRFPSAVFTKYIQQYFNFNAYFTDGTNALKRVEFKRANYHSCFDERSD